MPPVLHRHPGGNDIHFVLHDELTHGSLRFRHFIGRIDRNHIDFVAVNSALHFVDILEIVTLAFFVEFSPGRGRAGQVDRRPDFDCFFLCHRLSADHQYEDHRQ